MDKLIKIVVISDTHANQVLLRKALTHETGVDKIYHLGDYYHDMDENSDLTAQKEVLRVPGIMHPVYLKKQVPRILIDTVSTWRVALVHSLDDAAHVQADLILFGHTHHALFTHQDNQYYMNPGHLKKDYDRDENAGYAIMEISKNEIRITHKYIGGKAYQKNSISR